MRHTITYYFLPAIKQYLLRANNTFTYKLFILNKETIQMHEPLPARKFRHVTLLYRM